jgi:hypothetical protein
MHAELIAISKTRASLLEGPGRSHPLARSHDVIAEQFDDLFVRLAATPTGGQP